MRILGVSVGTLFMIAAIVFIVRKWGNDIPLVNAIN
jgi:hypothetical protein